MVLMGWLGALSFVLGVTLLALDAARSLTLGRFEATSLQVRAGGTAVGDEIPHELRRMPSRTLASQSVRRN